ncbi:MAG: hypothetical protein Q613_PSC00301G0002, partial [Propionibacterium sp. DORA_15]
VHWDEPVYPRAVEELSHRYFARHETAITDARCSPD